MDFNELIDDLQNHLIQKENEWIQQNLFYLHKTSLKHQSFSLLQDYCDKIILKSDDIKLIEKSMFMSILKRDDLRLEEIDVWNCIIKWGIGQSEEKLNKDISNWNKDDFINLKNILDDIIPLIRFNQISSNDFFEKIKPYKKAIDKKVYGEILEYYLYGKWKPRLLLQKGPRTKGKLLNLRTKCLISSWIDKKIDTYNKNNLPYKFRLILQGTKDGFFRSVFEDKCYNIEQTIVIMKTKETAELVGGYNPVCWNKPLDKSYYTETDKSFIFKINENQLNNSILSRVRYPRHAIFYPKQTYDFIDNNINITEVNFGFGSGHYDLL